MKDAYQPPRSFQQSGNVKDTYQRPKSDNGGEKVRVSDARPLDTPSAEEGRDKMHLPLLDRLFNPYNRYFRRKERYLENLSIQLSSYQGDGRVRKGRIAPGGSRRDKSVGQFKGNVLIPSRTAQRRSYEKVSAEHEQFTGHIRQLRPYQRERSIRTKLITSADTRVGCGYLLQSTNPLS